MTTLVMALQMGHHVYIIHVAVRDVCVMIHQAYIANDYIRDGIGCEGCTAVQPVLRCPLRNGLCVWSRSSHVAGNELVEPGRGAARG